MFVNDVRYFFDCLQDLVEKKLSQMILDKKFSGKYQFFMLIID